MRLSEMVGRRGSCAGARYMLALALALLAFIASTTAQTVDLVFNCAKFKAVNVDFTQVIKTLRQQVNGDTVFVTQINCADSGITGSIVLSDSDISIIAPRLQVFNFGTNFLEGVIPSNLGSLSNVLNLQLQENFLKGPIPDTLGKMQALQVLALNTNALSGSIPEPIYKLVKLTFLSLFNNQLSGQLSAGLGNLDALQNLLIGQNNFKGTIPAAIGGLSQLVNMDIRESGLSGTIPTDLGKLTNMQNLILFTNGLKGPLPEQLLTLPLIAQIHLADNKLSGKIPPAIGKAKTLQNLFLFSNQFEGPIPDSIYDLGNLLVLSLFNNQLSGTLSPLVSKLGSLQFYEIGQNQFKGPLPKELYGLKNLQNINVQENRLTGNLPDGLENLAKLQGLFIQDNSFEGELPFGLYKMSNLVSLNAEKNNFKCSIPSDIAGMQSLQFFDISNNLISGTLPSHIFQIPNMVTFDCVDNDFTGTFPSEVINWHFIRELFILGRNRWTGTMPPHTAPLTDCPGGFVFPTSAPTHSPTKSPSPAPTTLSPTFSPTIVVPTLSPTFAPTTFVSVAEGNTGDNDKNGFMLYVYIAVGVAALLMIMLAMCGIILMQRHKNKKLQEERINEVDKMFDASQPFARKLDVGVVLAEDSKATLPYSRDALPSIATTQLIVPPSAPRMNGPPSFGANSPAAQFAPIKASISTTAIKSLPVPVANVMRAAPNMPILEGNRVILKQTSPNIASSEDRMPPPAYKPAAKKNNPMDNLNIASAPRVNNMSVETVMPVPPPKIKTPSLPVRPTFAEIMSPTDIAESDRELVHSIAVPVNQDYDPDQDDDLETTL